MKERDLFSLIKSLWEAIEKNYLIYGICFSVFFCILNCLIGCKYNDYSCILDSFHTIIGFGITSLAFLSVHIKDGKHELPKAVSAVTLDVIISLIGLLSFHFPDCSLLHIITEFLVLFSYYWTAHCALHIASICLPSKKI